MTIYEQRVSEFLEAGRSGPEAVAAAWGRFLEAAEEAARAAKAAGELAVAEHDLEAAIAAFGRHEVLVRRVLPAVATARGHGSSSGPSPVEVQYATHRAGRR